MSRRLNLSFSRNLGVLLSRAVSFFPKLLRLSIFLHRND